RVENIRMILTPTAVIYGRVTDREGDAVGGAQVQALKPAYQDGRRVFQPVQNTTTNDLGEYRLFALPPGQYFILVKPPDTRATPPPLGLTFAALNLPALFEPYLPWYFPGTTDVRNASPIALTAGANFGADFSITATPKFHIRGY